MSMTEHLSEETRRRYQALGLSPSELLAVDDHLATCDDCRRQLATPAQAGRILAAFRAALDLPSPAESAHLSDRLLSDFFHRRLAWGERRRVERHLKGCLPCRELVEDMRAFSAPVGGREPDVTPPIATAWWQTLLGASWRVTPLLAAGTAALLVAIGMGIGLRVGRLTDRATLQARANSQEVARLSFGPEYARLRGSDSSPSLGRATDSIKALAPVDISVGTDRPLFWWQGPRDARNIAVRIYEVVSQAGKLKERELLPWTPVSGTSWTAPPGLLHRGGLYLWQVRAGEEGAAVVSAPVLFQVQDRQAPAQARRVPAR